MLNSVHRLECTYLARHELKSTIVSMVNAIAGALWQGQGGGKLAVMGSVAMFDDKWLDSEDNSKIMDWLFRWLKQV